MDPLTDGSATRLLVASAFSVVCHLGVLLLVSVVTWHAGEVSPPRLIAVALVGGGGGELGGGAAAGSGESSGSAPAVPPPAIAAPVVPAPAARVAAPRKEPPLARRRGRTRAPRTVPTVKQPAPEQLAAVAANVSLPAPASASAGTLDGSGSGGAGDGGGAGTGPGTGAGRGGGSGSGVGEGAATGDGLRVWCRTCPAPEYPVRARRQGWEGTVHVDLEVDGDGAVVAARVGESSGFGPLDAAAVAAARRSRFTPPAGGAGLRGRLRYRFVLEDSTRASATTDERRVR